MSRDFFDKDGNFFAKATYTDYGTNITNSSGDLLARENSRGDLVDIDRGAEIIGFHRGNAYYDKNNNLICTKNAYGELVNVDGNVIGHER